MLCIRIRIPIHLMAVLDSNPYWIADPDPGASKFTKINKQTRFPAFQKGFCIFVGIVFDLFPTVSSPFM
jgi:hypothetical protein